ncbi:phospholipid carrier-dependent glycosyltransferase [Rhodococcus sp. 24CO]|uniref:phospholipid carrier-dependent glycosyltransferase n=1 Tax=Rhodococcus sp. 24CO TaxID=3117460 RepID=UPI003D34A2C3
MIVAAPAESRTLDSAGPIEEERQRLPWGVYTAVAVGYIALGVWLNAEIKFIFTDAMSRVAAVSAMLWSRDPHFAAIGFVFTPLTAVAQIPLGLLGNWFPELLRWNITASVTSALFMAGAVMQIRGIARDRGCARWVTIIVTVLFALNPMILMYAANGMSEALYLFFVIWAVRRLIRWMRNDDAHELIAAGLALALAYLTRYDALAPMFVAVVLVFVVSWLRFPKTDTDDKFHRSWAAAIDATVVLLPGLIAFLAWSASSWLITGQAFQQFSSVYGNSAIIEQAGGAADTPLTRMMFSLTEIAVLGPAFPVLAAAAIVLAWRRRDPEVIVPIVLFGSVLGAQTLLYMMGSTFPFLRFYLAVVPLCFVLAVLISPRERPVVSRRPGRAASSELVRDQPRYSGPSIMLVVALVLLLGSTAVTFVAMGSARLASLEHSFASVVIPGRQDAAEQAILRTFGAERRIADYLDDLDLPDGSVLTDTVLAFGVITASDNPKQFVITSDTDFVKILNNPSESGVEYILTVPNEERGVADAINRRYPTMYETGSGGIGALVIEVENDGGTVPPNWRLYRLTGNKQEGG